MSNWIFNRSGLCALTCFGALALSSVAQADSVVEQIELGLEHYAAQDYANAINELEFAIADIRKLMSGQIASTFPDAPAGWTAEDADTSAGGGAAAMFGGAMSIIQRKYAEESGRGRLEASLMTDNPMVQGMAAMFSNPAMIAAQPNLERVRIGRESAIVKWEENRSRAEVTMLLDGRILLQVKGQQLDSPDVAVDLLRAWDLDAVRAQTAR